jgi:hypothetical protein
MTIVATEISRNKKTGLAAVTYAPIQTCPKDCPFIDKGCYAKYGPLGMITKRIESKDAKKALAEEEAEKILAMSGRLPLRLHIVGDCATKEAARILSRAAEEYAKRFNKPVWTYTHAWKRVPREAWGNVSVLASCETMEEVEKAYLRGYAAAIVSDATKRTKQGAFYVVPCMNQADKKTKCVDCGLCFDDKRLRQSWTVISFKPHGTCKKDVSRIVAEKNEEAQR